MRNPLASLETTPQSIKGRPVVSQTVKVIFLRMKILQWKRAQCLKRITACHHIRNIVKIF